MRSSNRTWKVAVAATAALALVAAGCGDDDEATTETTAADTENDIDPEFADYCAIAIQLDEQEDFPSTEQLESLRGVAPDEISEEIDVVVDAFLAAGDDPFAAFEEPGVDEAFGPIEDFEADHCGIEHDDEDDQDPSVTVLDPEAAQVDVTATDYAFALDPAAPGAGRTSFVMTNQGQERHVMVLVQFEEGGTMEQVLASEGDEGAESELESAFADAGEEAVLTADLVSGEYGLLCYLPNAEGTPHYELGMQEQFTVA